VDREIRAVKQGPCSGTYYGVGDRYAPVLPPDTSLFRRVSLNSSQTTIVRSAFYRTGLILVNSHSFLPLQYRKKIVKCPLGLLY